MAKGPKLFTCPKCRHTYLGHDPAHDCPRCGYDYRGGKEGFRWDVVAYVAVILALLSVFAMSFYYRDMARMPRQSPNTNTNPRGNEHEKLPGAREIPFQSPYRERGQ
jgi:hypothetical protein